ncbi:hypothetical protein [Pararhodobacter marinus]|uniref:hypothetical protein n=1 Tax=Pararhodobacter marinus TaxID=2184063 RepID=UPI003183FE23
MFNVLMVSIGGPETFLRLYRDRDAEFAEGPEVATVFQALADARVMTEGSNAQEWNIAARMVIEGQAGGQIMGDWVQGEFTQAGLAAGEDFTCLLGLGEHEYIAAAGDAFYFPLIEDPAVVEAQDNVARVILDPATQVAFTAAKGALPVRRDVELQDPTPCMQAGIEALQAGQVVDSVNSLVSPDTLGQITDLVVEFLADPDFSVEESQAEFAQIIATAD